MYVGYSAVSMPRLYELFREEALLFIIFVHHTEWNQEMLFPPFFFAVAKPSNFGQIKTMKLQLYSA